MNTHYLKYQVQKGFTLVELLIVVIILAILAAIVVPQFASSTDDAKISSLDSTLSNMRSAVDLYRQQHSAYPGEVTAVPAACTGTAGVGTGGDLATFYEQLSMYTNAAGQACSKQDAGFDYGPYLKKVPLPANPVTNDAAVVVVSLGDLNMPGDAGVPGHGWKYDVKTGKFIANDVNPDPDGVRYDQH
ncbi:MAG: prepilin-type N-terminal cleavage/methylation domain-containing protein [Halobacteria archaeon]|nr:prepilin-type N-terminal cleavage/methylation domain-containing protein [Halobacteria archaeon]